MDVEALKKMKKNKKAIIKHIPHIAGPCLTGQASALFCYIYIIYLSQLVDLLFDFLGLGV
jgi:hypothetical protein